MNDQTSEISTRRRNILFDVIFWMVCFYIFLSIERPWESIRYLNSIPIERVYAILMIAAALLTGRFRIVRSPFNKWIYGLLLIHFILAPFAFSPKAAVFQGIEYAKAIILYTLMLSVSDDENALKLLVKAYIFSIIFYSLHSLWEYSNGRYVFRMGISRMVGVDAKFNDPNAFGASIVIALPFVYSLLRVESYIWLRRLYYLYYCIAVICIVLTGSRSAALAFIFLLLLWAIASKGLRKLKIFAALLPVIFLIWMLMPAEKQNRIRTLWDPEAGPANAQTSAEGRTEGFKVSWRMFKQVPLTGVGAGGDNFVNYRIAHHMDDDGRATSLQAHNLYGEVLAEFGIVGFLLLCGLIGAIFKNSFFARRQLGRTDNKSFSYHLSASIIAALCLLLFLGLAGHNFYRPMWLWLAAWSGAILRNLRNRSNPAEQYVHGPNPDLAQY